jgi:FtsH-binding integral membrane protein
MPDLRPRASASAAHGFLIFAEMTALDTQRLREMYSVTGDGTITGQKAVIGALQLYLEFVNLLFFLLGFLGNRGCNNRLCRILRDPRRASI